MKRQPCFALYVLRCILQNGEEAGMTIDQMAKELGVSKSTVSRALSGKGRIGEETRLKIQSFAEKKGFFPIQKEEEQEKTKNIGVVIPVDAYTTSIPFFQECLLGISEAASMLQYYVVIITCPLNDISGIQALVENKKVDGMILMRSVEDDRILRYLTDIHFPTGLTGTCDYEEVIQVDSDSRDAAENLTSLLIGQGYRRFAMVVGNVGYKVNADRCRGFYNALERYGIPREQQLVYPNFVNVELLDSIISDVFARKVECIVCADDVICTRLMSRLQAEGYRIPHDISIVSLYHSTNLDCFSPAVTAVNISAKQIGNMIGKQMINYLQENEYCPKTIMDYEILFRKSAGKVY